MSEYISRSRVVELQEVETLVWLSARFRKKIRAAVSASERRLCKRALQALNRHLTILGERYAPATPQVKSPSPMPDMRGRTRKET